MEGYGLCDDRKHSKPYVAVFEEGYVGHDSQAAAATLPELQPAKIHSKAAGTLVYKHAACRCLGG